MKEIKNTDTMNSRTLPEHAGLTYASDDIAMNETWRPLSMYDHPAASLAVMIICGMVDIVMFYTLFSKIAYDSAALRFIATLALFIGFDFGPIYLGMKLKEKHQGRKVSNLPFILFISAFVTAFMTNVYLRVMAKDIVLGASAYGSGSGDVNPLALPWAVFAMLAPVVTSFVSFGISYCTYDYLAAKTKRIFAILQAKQSDLRRINAALAEYEAAGEYREARIALDDERYDHAVSQAKEQGVCFCDYVRERLKEHIGEASSTNELSKASCLKIMKDLEETRQAIQDTL